MQRATAGGKRAREVLVAEVVCKQLWQRDTGVRRVAVEDEDTRKVYCGAPSARRNWWIG